MRHYAAAVAAASLLAVAGAACAAPRPTSGPRPLRARSQPVLVFDNATPEPVRVYLVEHGNEWAIGWVQPGRTELLRLPVEFESLRGRQLSLSVVPLASGFSLGGPPAARREAIRSEPILGAPITAMRWRLVGKWLLAYPIPGAP